MPFTAFGFLHSLRRSIQSPAMSAATLPEAGQRSGDPKFPGNCSLEAALGAIVDVYHRYSARSGSLDLLSFDDFNVLLHEQARHFLQNCGRDRASYLRDLFRETDLSKDRQLSFEEFSTVLAKLTDDAHRLSHGHDPCGPDRD
ncbi:protein S100-A8-like isoform X1 [Patagioenas fasciata]|uniref:protein S100-A8-like isoform X1 n=2 Tax=Patagioenas fasciata TaxID=372321 RepID=UPI0032E8E288